MNEGKNSMIINDQTHQARFCGHCQRGLASKDRRCTVRCGIAVTQSWRFRGEYDLV